MLNFIWIILTLYGLSKHLDISECFIPEKPSFYLEFSNCLKNKTYHTFIDVVLLDVV